MTAEEELEQFYKDVEEFENRKNLRMMIDELDFSNYNYIGSETIIIKPIYSSSKSKTINIKKHIKKSNNNLF